MFDIDVFGVHVKSSLIAIAIITIHYCLNDEGKEEQKSHRIRLNTLKVKQCRMIGVNSIGLLFASLRFELKWKGYHKTDIWIERNNNNKQTLKMSLRNVYHHTRNDKFHNFNLRPQNKVNFKYRLLFVAVF